MSGRRIDLSATQVIASVLAAVTGAIAASYLGVAGTIIGTAVMSVAGTAGAAIYKHVLGRGQEKLKSAAAQMTPAAYRRPRRTADPASAETEILPAYREWRRPPSARPTTRRETRRGTEPLAGPMTRWDTGRGGQTVPAGWTRPVAGNGAGQPDWRSAATRRDTLTGGPGAGGPGPRRPGPRGRAGGPEGRRRPRWLVPAAAALCVFLAVLGFVTAFEAAAGKPLDALIWGRHGTGTSVGSLVSGDTDAGGSTQHARHAPRNRHPVSPAPAPPSPSQTPIPSPSATPTRTPSPAPSPSSTPSASASPSPKPTAGAGSG